MLRERVAYTLKAGLILTAEDKQSLPAVKGSTLGKRAVGKSAVGFDTVSMDTVGLETVGGAVGESAVGVIVSGFE